ncbi:MAG: alpha-amylase [Bacteroidetes bacterium]|nr:MAG: alpha-amylase [Bacteroidota bacterium]
MVSRLEKKPLVLSTCITMNQKIYFLPLLLGVAVWLGCANYLGNPHPRPMEARTVPAVPADMRVDPPNWWTNMLHNRVELLVHRQQIGEYQVSLGKTRGVRLLRMEPADSPDYLFVTLEIDPDAPPQRVPLVFKHPEQDRTITVEFPVLQRNLAPKGQGISSRDVLYLIFPDRFANGDRGNDSYEGMREVHNRQDPDGRHGGDLKGIAEHLDYLQDLGITAIWLNPELENDQAQTSYHGYAITDLYRVDRRLGTNEQYRELVRQCHDRGIRVVRDVVPNHIGHLHPWMEDLPMKDWLNNWPEFTSTSYRSAVQADPYASEYDKKRFNKGWYVPSMPDLNHQNPHLANYLIQQALWWVEYSGLDAFRIDTYGFSDPEFMSRYCAAIRAEYPAIFLFGEIWENSVLMQGFYADDQPLKRAGFDSNLPGVVDFQLNFALLESLKQEQTWQEGVSKLYYTLAQDYMYMQPLNNVIMLDNHDMVRFFSEVDGNLVKYKSGLAILLTTRGIPQLYYGTEILLAGRKEPSDGNVRQDFPGGWSDDPVNKFTPSGRTVREEAAFQYLRTLIRYRNATPALQTGKLMQFVPEDGVYVYFRYDAEKTVMVVFNSADETRTVITRRYAERMTGYRRGRDVVTGEMHTDLSSLTVAANTALVLELER